jgi:hypothetical protein
MKALAIALLVFGGMASSAQAAPRANIFCKVQGKVVSALSERGRYDCAASLVFGLACYRGPRAEVIRLLNSPHFNWDEEWIENARFMGRSEISYEFVDGPNELREKLSMGYCPSSFFSR